MGMGEPMLNFAAVVRAFHVINGDLGIGARNITISTVGVHKQIPRLAALGLQCVLAVSLHAPTQALRESIVPSARVYPIDAILDDCALYFKQTSRQVTFEYTLLAGVNDAPEQVGAVELGARPPRSSPAELAELVATGALPVRQCARAGIPTRGPPALAQPGQPREPHPVEPRGRGRVSAALTERGAALQKDAREQGPVGERARHARPGGGSGMWPAAQRVPEEGAGGVCSASMRL